MLNYIIRRVLYMIPIVLGVMVVTFLLFNVAQKPRMMAKRILGEKASAQVIENWLQQRGYDKPLFINTAPGRKLLDSQFFNHMRSLALFRFGVSDRTGEPITQIFRRGALPSLMITLPALLVGLTLSVSIALFLVLVRESRVDQAGIVVCVILMSVSYMAYIIFGQWLVAVKASYFPAFGFNLEGFGTVKYLLLPVGIMVISELGAEVRLYRSIFIEEIRQDYVRTAQAKGASSYRVLFVHVLKNGMIALITMVVASLPFLIMGSLLIEKFFGIPGLGGLTIDAVQTANFSVVRAVVYLGSLLYLGGLLLTDICYAAVDPRIRFK
jgi:peptide/nickel transport system permease protein